MSSGMTAIAFIFGLPLLILFLALATTWLGARYGGRCPNGGLHRWADEGFSCVCEKCGAREPINPYLRT